MDVQNRRQKVFNRGASLLCRGAGHALISFMFFERHLSVLQIIVVYRQNRRQTVFIGGLHTDNLNSTDLLIFGRTKPTKAPRGDETADDLEIL